MTRWPRRLAHGLGGDLTRGARRLMAAPLFSIFAVLSLAVGIGVTTAAYSVVNSIFLRDLGFRDPDHVLFVVTPYDGRFLQGSISEPDFRDLRQAQTSFSSLSASASFSPAVASAYTTERLAAEAVDGAYLATLGVTAALGRTIQGADDDGGSRVVVLSHTLWRTRFAADRQIVGHTVRISGQPFEIIGVAPAGFRSASGLPGTKLWIPLSAEASFAPTRDAATTSSRNRRRLRVFGRLAPGATTATASAEMASIAAGLDVAFPPPPRATRAGPTERPWRAKSIADIAHDDNLLRRFGLMLVALVALVLLVACTNLANLVLARGTTRLQEFTVRCALGAPRWRIVREECAESVLLGLAGAICSYLVFEGLRVAMDAEFNIPIPMGGYWTIVTRPEPNLTAIAIAAASLLLSLVVFGLEPALRLTRSVDIRGALAANTGGIGHPNATRQRTLLRWQVAISAAFFMIATMFIRYTIEEARHDSGVVMERLGIAVLSLQTEQWNEARVRRTLDRVMDEARKDPAIDAVAASTGMPFGVRTTFRFTLSIPGGTGDRTKAAPDATGIAATPAIFTTLGVPILRGRGFDDRDQSSAAPVVVLSAFTARQLFGTIDAVGRPVVLQSHPSQMPVATVIGIAGDTAVGYLFGEPRAFVYLPLSQRYDPFLTIAVRSTGNAPVAVRALRDALRRADPDLAVDAIGTGRDILTGPFVLLRAVGVAALALGAVTLLLAMAGLFGIQSHVVAHRTREIGVRISLGASAAQIRRMVLADGYRPVFEGLALGLFIGLTGRAIVRAYLDIDVTVIDPWMLLVTPIPLLLAAFCACYLPAQRAAGVDPNVALRHL